MAKENLCEVALCALPAALDVVGERWSWLILRGSFNGLRHFEQFQSTIGVARNILANRLTRLVAKGILSREPMASDRRKVEYRLTEKGAALLPALVALRQWGETWEVCAQSTPVLVDVQKHQPVRKIALYAQDGRELVLDDLCWTHAEDVRPVDYLKAVRAA